MKTFLRVIIVLFFTVNLSAQNYSLELDGVDDYVGDMSENRISGNMPFTVECWVKIEGVDPVLQVPYPIVNKGFNTTDWIYNMFFEEYPVGLENYRFGIYAGEPPSYVFDKLKINQWQHIAGVRSANGYLYLFVDGNKSDSLFVGNASLTFVSTGLRFGRYLDSVSYLKGKLTRIRISAIARYVNNFIPTAVYQNDINTVGIWNFYEGSGTVLHDESANNIHGNIYGSPVWSTDFPTVQSLRLTSPNGGEQYSSNSSITINWVSQDINNVKIEYSSNNGANWNSIVSSTPANTGNYDWTAPNITSTQCLIKICDVANPSFCDQSDGTFTIAPIQQITVTQPNGGETWLIGSTQDITWSSTNVINVKIELSINNGASWSTIVDSTASTGVYSWSLNLSQRSNQALIRISDISDENIFDQSDDVFVIDIFLNVDEEFSGMPDSYKLLQNYPNPFNPYTTIYYGLPEESSVNITIYDILGNEVMVYKEEKQPAGYHKREFDATEYGSGVYFYRIQAVPNGRQAGSLSASSGQSFIETKKMVLLR